MQLFDEIFNVCCLIKALMCLSFSNRCKPRLHKFMFFANSVGTRTQMGQKDKDGYYAELCHFFSTLEPNNTT